MSNAAILRLIGWYLLGVPLISSLNGLSMHLLGVSVLGPIYHALFSALLIGVALVSGVVEKSWGTITLLFGTFAALVATQLASGFSLPADVGQLYKWFMPLLLFAVYYRWSYFQTDEGRAALVTVFQRLPVWYSALITLSLVVYVLTGFEATVFEQGVRRFSGFTWAYNPVVNAFFICGYVNYFVGETSLLRTLFYVFAFYNLRSKTSIIYFTLAALGLVRRMWGAAWRFGVLRWAGAVPVTAAVLWIGLRASLQATTIYGGGTGSQSSVTRFVQEVQWRGVLAAVALADIPQWPTANLLVGNGMEIDRRLVDPMWASTIGVAKFGDVDLTKSNKAPELDFLGPVDIFGLVGMACFVAVFYLYPLIVARSRMFRRYYVLLIVLSLLSGHLINNPEATTLLVFFILLARDYPGVHRGMVS